METTPFAAGASSYEPNTATRPGSEANAARIRSNASAWTSTSESTNTSSEPAARAAPALRAAAGPDRGGASTTMISSGGPLARRIAATQRSSVAGSSVAGTITLSRSESGGSSTALTTRPVSPAGPSPNDEASISALRYPSSRYQSTYCPHARFSGRSRPRSSTRVAATDPRSAVRTMSESPPSGGPRPRSSASPPVVRTRPAATKLDRSPDDRPAATGAMRAEPNAQWHVAEVTQRDLPDSPSERQPLG